MNFVDMAEDTGTKELVHEAKDKEVSVVESATKLFTGERKLFQDFDFRCFFLIGDRETLARRIDHRCAQMLLRGLLLEVANLLLDQKLALGTSPARAIGYRQAIDYLLRQDAQENDIDAFKAFFNDFTTASRNYAASQMKWYRKDKQFLWLKTQFDEASLQMLEQSVERVLHLSGDEYILERELPAQNQLRQENVQQGKKMKFHSLDAKLFLDLKLPELISDVDTCTAKLRNSGCDQSNIKG